MSGEGYVFETLGRCDFVILCGQGHWLTRRARVSVRELAEEKLICDRSRMDVETLTALCQSCGFSPNIAFEVDNSDLIFSLLSHQQGVAFMPMAQMRKISREYPDSGIHMVLLEDPGGAGLSGADLPEGLCVVPCGKNLCGVPAAVAGGGGSGHPAYESYNRNDITICGKCIFLFGEKSV